MMSDVNYKKMSNKYIITVCLVAITALNSCKKDFLELSAPNFVSVSDYYKTENDVLLALNGLYQSIRSSNCLGEGSSLFTEQRSDNTGTTDNQSNAGEPFQFTDFSLVPSNSYLQTHWSALYQTISRSNQVLSGMEKIKFTNEATKKQYTAELKFIRALIYFHLVRKWGDVPLVTKQLNTLDEVAANTYREKKQNVYAHIVEDLLEVVNSSLPNIQPLANKGRVSLTAGNALLGQVYLTMATTLDQADRNANLNNAKKYLTAAYNMKAFNQLSDIPYADIFDVNKKSTNAEIILQIVYRQGDPSYSSSIARTNQARGETINSLAVSQGAGGNMTMDLVKEYEANDLRKDFSIKYASNPTVQTYFITKFRDASAAAGNLGYGGNDWILMRHADVILMLAEVHMYLNENATAIQFLDMVRDRAKLPKYAVMQNNPDYSTKFPTLKLAILHERRVELAFENHRWFDLLRFFNIDDLVKYMHAKNQSDYNNSRLLNFTGKDQYFPIPLNETKLDAERMYQNSGY